MAERSEVQRSLQMGAHEQLYADAERRRQKMEEMQVRAQHASRTDAPGLMSRRSLLE
jgi:hypothetical protein